MIEVKVDTKALEELIKRLEGLGEKQVTRAMADAIFEEADANVPVDEGHLKASGKVEPRANGDTAVVYGGPKAQHAAAVHESPNIQPKTGKKKWLRDAAMQRRKILDAAAKATKKIIEGR